MHIAMLIAVLAAQEPSEHLKPLAWLVGTWEGGGKYGDQEFADSVKYEWSHNGKFIKWTAEARMDGEVVHSETGMMGYDSAKQKIVWFSFALDGTIGHGEDAASKAKDTWEFVAAVGAEPPWNDTISIMRKVDDDTFENEVKTKKDGVYETFFKGTYRRKKEQQPLSRGDAEFPLGRCTGKPGGRSHERHQRGEAPRLGGSAVGRTTESSRQRLPPPARRGSTSP